MKKFLMGCVLILQVVLFTGCGKEEVKTMTCDLTKNDKITGYNLTSKYEVHYVKDEVVDVKTVEKIETDKEEMITYFKNYLEETYQKMNNEYGGYTYDIKSTDKDVTATVMIDYSKVNMEQLGKDDSSIKKMLTENNKLPVDGLKAMYESTGAICTK